mgnify:CR=1 FL=1
MKINTYDCVCHPSDKCRYCSARGAPYCCFDKLGPPQPVLTPILDKLIAAQVQQLIHRLQAAEEELIAALRDLDKYFTYPPKS